MFAACPDHVPVYITIICPAFCMYCSVVINCFSVLLIIMLHMDLNPSSSESSLQKTSPHTDPEALRQLSTDFSADYVLIFHTLAAQAVWDTLKLLFCKSLNIELQSKLACHDEGRTLNRLIDPAIHIDSFIRSLRPIIDSLSPLPNRHLFLDSNIVSA